MFHLFALLADLRTDNCVVLCEIDFLLKICDRFIANLLVSYVECSYLYHLITYFTSKKCKVCSTDENHGAM